TRLVVFADSISCTKVVRVGYVPNLRVRRSASLDTTIVPASDRRMQQSLVVISLTLASFVGAGCGSSSRYMAMYIPPHPMLSRILDEVDVVRQEPQRPHLRVGVIEAMGGSESERIHELRARAGKEGCDAIIPERTEYRPIITPMSTSFIEV